ncbi:MAG: NUDIX domain-containing protein, partial [bacterium]
MKYAANCLVIKEDKILLGWKKRGFGAGLLTGIGGKKNPEETYADAAARELFEESGVVVDPQKIELAAVVEYVFAGESAWIV